jgi:hypothetical protein
MALGVTALLVASVGGLRSADGASGPVIDMRPASSAIAIGETVDVYVHVENVQNLGVYEFYIRYDVAVVEVVAVATAGFLGSTGRRTSCINDSRPGEVRYACNTTGPTPAGPSGDGRLGGVRFRGVADGVTSLHFTKLGLGVEEGSGIPIADYKEGAIKVGTGGSSGGGNGGSGGGGNGGSGGGLPPTPTKVPGALTPTIPEGAPTHPPDADPNDPALIYPDGRTHPTDGSVASPRSNGSNGVTGIIRENVDSARARVESARSGESFPVAGTGTQSGDRHGVGWALVALVLAGLVLLGAGVGLNRRPGRRSRS